MDRYTKTVLTVIAFCLVVLTVKEVAIEPAVASDSYIISRILYCIDGSTISGGSLSTYCNG